MTPPATGKESRDISRVAKMVTLLVKQLSYPITSDPGETGTCKNISEDGVCFSIPTAYEMQERLCLTIDLVGWQHHKKGVAQLINESLAFAPLTVIAEVTWCQALPDKKGVEIGAKFLDIPEDDLKALKRHLNQFRQTTTSRTSEV